MPNIPNDDEPRYLSYLLRLWRKTNNQGRQVWCASLEAPGSHRTVRFGDLPALFAFLQIEAGSATPGEPASENNQTNKGEEPMSTELNKALLRRSLEGAVNEKNISILDEILAHDFVEREQLGPGIPPNVEGTKQFFAMILSAFPDLHCTIEDEIAEGDRVVVRSKWSGTHQGEFMGVPPTGKSVTFPVIDIGRVEYNKVVEHWGQADLMGLLMQIGAIPAPGA